MAAGLFEHDPKFLYGLVFQPGVRQVPRIINVVFGLFPQIALEFISKASFDLFGPISRSIRIT